MEIERRGKIHRGNGFAIIEKYGEYQISWEQGPYNEPVFYPISKQNMDKAFKSIKTFMK